MHRKQKQDELPNIKEFPSRLHQEKVNAFVVKIVFHLLVSNEKMKSE